MHIIIGMMQGHLSLARMSINDTLTYRGSISLLDGPFQTLRVIFLAGDIGVILLAGDILLYFAYIFSLYLDKVR